MPRKFFKRTKYFRQIFYLIVISAIAYFPSFNSSFHFDDFNTFANPDFVALPFIDIIKQFPARWITYYTFKLNLYSNTFQLFGFHIVNWAIHVACAYLVFLLSLVLITIVRRRKITIISRKSAILISFFIGAVFALHTLQSQAVIYLSQRAALIASLCYLLILLNSARTMLPTTLSYKTYLWMFIFFAVGIFSKEIIISVPFAVIILILTFRKPPFLDGGKYLKNKYLIIIAVLSFLLPLFSLLILAKFNLHNLFYHLKSLGACPLNLYKENLTFFSYILTQCVALPRYMLFFFFPVGLSIDHNPLIITSVLTLPFILSIVLIISLVAFAFAARKQFPIFSFGCAFYFITLLPHSVLLPSPDIIVEHRTYLAVASLLWMVIGIALPFLARYRILYRLIIIALFASCIILTVMTWKRSCVWKTEFSLWADAYDKAPYKQRVVNNYACALIDSGQPKQAINIIEHASLQWKRMLPDVFCTIGYAYEKLNDFDRATNAFETGMKCDSWSNPDLRYNYIIFLQRYDCYRKAKEELDLLIKLHPDYCKTHNLKKKTN